MTVLGDGRYDGAGNDLGMAGDRGWRREWNGRMARWVGRVEKRKGFVGPGGGGGRRLEFRGMTSRIPRARRLEFGRNREGGFAYRAIGLGWIGRRIQGKLEVTGRGRGMDAKDRFRHVWRLKFGR